MTAEQPTAQGISRLLGKAGIDKSEARQNGRIKGLTERSAGYIATKSYGGESVRVESTPGTWNRGEAAEQRAAELLDRCAEAIRAAGWKVTVDNYGSVPHLIVTAKPEGA